MKKLKTSAALTWATISFSFSKTAIYISDDALANKIWTELKNTVNTRIPDKTVRSRAGKTSNQLVFATIGITVSITRNEVDFIEIYPPCSVEDYLQNIYREPQAFIK